MRIGIITFHRADNCGAVLQCYALQEYLRRQGHEAEVIDYRCLPLEAMYVHVGRPSVKGLLYNTARGRLGTYLETLRKLRVRKEKFDNFRSVFLNTSCSCSEDTMPQDYDVYIIGSDQMWTVGCVGKKVDNVYMGRFKRPDASRLCGYAISSIGDFTDYLSKDEITAIVQGYDGLSFREKSIADLVESITGRTPSVTLDPTLLTDSDVYDRVLDDSWKAKGDYIVTYQVHNKGLDAYARHYADKYGWKVYELNGGDYGVEDFLSAIRYAKGIITSSFHATVFSLIFCKPFVSYCYNDKYDDRYKNLLLALGLEEHLRQFGNEVGELPQTDKATFETRLQKLRQPSVDFLDNVIKR